MDCNYWEDQALYWESEAATLSIQLGEATEEIEQLRQRAEKAEAERDINFATLDALVNKLGIDIEKAALSQGKPSDVFMEYIRKRDIEQQIKALDKTAFSLRFHLKGELTSDSVDKFIHDEIKQLRKELEK